jgi:hypothetical protein
MNNHKKISFKAPEVVPMGKSGMYSKIRYHKRKPNNEGPEKQYGHPPPDHTNPSREDHITRILNMQL